METRVMFFGPLWGLALCQVEVWYDLASVHSVAQQVYQKRLLVFSDELFSPNHLLPLCKVGRVDVIFPVIFEGGCLSSEG